MIYSFSSFAIYNDNPHNKAETVLLLVGHSMS